MSYDSLEASIAAGEPYFLYLFDNGSDIPTRLTSEPVNLTRMGEQWYPSPVSHGEIEFTGNVEKQDLLLTFPLADTYAQTLLDPALLVTTVTVWRGHRSDVAEELRVYWRGRVVGAKDQPRKIEVSVESIFTSMRRPGLRARYQRSCRFVLYGQDGCKLNRADFEVLATVTAVNGLVLTVPDAATVEAKEYLGGIVNYVNKLHFIVGHSGEQLTLSTAFASLTEDVNDHGPQLVLLSPGCNLSLDRCEVRFANDINHGGFPWLPTENPFETRIV